MPSQSTTSHASKPDTEPNSTSPSAPLEDSNRPSLPTTGPEQSTQQTNLSTPRSPVRRGPRGTRKISAQATKLEAVSDNGDPLGPLGDTAFESGPPLDEQAPIPPQKEPFAARNARPTSSTSHTSGGAGMVDSVNLAEDGASFRGPPPVHPPADTEGTRRQSQPSVSVEQAAKPTFQITVGDPHKVGDLTSSHIVYQVRTMVGIGLQRSILL